MDWNKQAKKLRGRSWSQLSRLWIGVSPTDSQAGKAPDIAVGDLESLAAVLSQANEPTLRLFVDPGGVRQGLLLEALFLFHKAAHVLGATQVHLRAGMLSWSLAGGYQSATFSMRSILLLFGIGVVETKIGDYIIDAWSPPEGSTKKERSAEPGIALYKVRRPDHLALWTILLRMLRVVQVEAELWPVAFVSEICELDERDFAKQRNRLHYRNGHWPPHGDLHVCVAQGAFGTIIPTDQIYLDATAPDFSVTLAATLFFLVGRLLGDLARLSNVIGGEVDLVRGWFDSEFLAPWRSALLDHALR